ncbi:hypothetical protein BR93DRAFT_945406 [Coniochaeta sp. PMI_546]|nr:hypothetical protein BR93DRAFT_945406 [Coniochaeta sp. PMI_546]
MLENEGIPSGIPRYRTYATDSKVINQPNAIHNQDDGESQLAALAALRTTMHHFISPEYREGPFFYTLSDLHQGNIFVDEQWNIQTIIDLEWACAKPIEMQLPPYWLTSRAVDGFYDAGAISEYEALLDEYLDIYEAEERRCNGCILQAPIKRRVWKSGGFWYFHAVSVPKGMYNIFNRHAIFDEVFFWYWGFDAQEMVDKKLGDQVNYLTKVREVFGQHA